MIAFVKLNGDFITSIKVILTMSNIIFKTLHSEEATVEEKEMNQSSKKTKYLVLVTMFCSIEVLLMFTPLGFIPIGPMKATTMHIPVILAGILLGIKGGAITGLVFGISSVVNATINPTILSFVFTPFYSLGEYHGNFMSLVIAIVPRVLLGVLGGLIYSWFKNRDKNMRLFGSGVTALVCTLIHSILVLGMIYYSVQVMRQPKELKFQLYLAYY